MFPVQRPDNRGSGQSGVYLNPRLPILVPGGLPVVRGFRYVGFPFQPRHPGYFPYNYPWGPRGTPQLPRMPGGHPGWAPSQQPGASSDDEVPMQLDRQPDPRGWIPGRGPFPGRMVEISEPGMPGSPPTDQAISPDTPPGAIGGDTPPGAIRGDTPPGAIGGDDSDQPIEPDESQRMPSRPGESTDQAEETINSPPKHWGAASGESPDNIPPEATEDDKQTPSRIEADHPETPLCRRDSKFVITQQKINMIKIFAESVQKYPKNMPLEHLDYIMAYAKKDVACLAVILHQFLKMADFNKCRQCFDLERPCSRSCTNHWLLVFTILTSSNDEKERKLTANLVRRALNEFLLVGHGHYSPKYARTFIQLGLAVEMKINTETTI